MANQLMIEFNNRAVESVMAGNVFAGFELLSEAMEMLPVKYIAADEDDFPDYPELQEYLYVWCDCKNIFRNGIPDSLFGVHRLPNEGSLAFVHKALIKVYPRYDSPEFGLPIYGFGWVIRFNLAVLCTMYGISLGERGHKLCHRAKSLMDHLQIRFDDELLIPSKQWTLPQLALSCNQACVAAQLGQSADVIDHLDDVNGILNVPDQYDIMNVDCREFALCAKLLLQSTLMASAA